jgi:hypothetical protein
MRKNVLTGVAVIVSLLSGLPVLWRVYVDSGDDVSVVVKRGGSFEAIVVAGRAPVTLEAGVVPIRPGSLDAQRARSDRANCRALCAAEENDGVIVERTGESEAIAACEATCDAGRARCERWNPEWTPRMQPSITDCYRIEGVRRSAGPTEVNYQPGGVDDAGSLYKDIYVVDGQVVTPRRTIRLGFFEALLGWVPAAVVAAVVFRVMRAIFARLS